MIPIREMERMMKLQDVILKAMAKNVSWIDAAEIAGMSVWNMQRKRQTCQEYGYTGLFDQRGRFHSERTANPREARGESCSDGGCRRERRKNRRGC